MRRDTISTFNRLLTNAYLRKGYRSEGEFVEATEIPVATYYRHKKAFSWTAPELRKIFSVGDWHPEEIVEALA